MNRKALERLKARLASEQGTVFRDWGGRISVAIIYPNTYFVGMSNLGLQVLYGLLNQSNGIVCERVFWEGYEPASMESQRPLGDFDVLAFSLSYEHDYFNAARLLKSSGIPLRSADRDERHPLVLAGGAAVTANPEPLADFIDVFAIGEAEAILPSALPVLLEGIGAPRHELLKSLASIPGLYVPTISQNPVLRRFAEDLGVFDATSVVLSRESELGDLYLIEISRGCARGCRFCLAGYHFRPMRYRSAKALLCQVERGLHYRKRMGLVAAAVSDYPEIDDLVRGIRNLGAGISVSSVRVKPLSKMLLQGLAESGTGTITLAPEAGTERLRRVIAKGISEDDIMRAVEVVAGYRFKQLKLYFMIGLPTETNEDILAIVTMARSAKEIVDRYRLGMQITLNITPFVPKAGTPFQWLPMATADVLKHRLALLKKELCQLGIEVKAESIEWSVVQGMLARGDSRLGEAIAGMSKVTLANWRRGLETIGVDPGWVHRRIPFEERVPWSVVDSGTPCDMLQAELEKAYRDGN